MGLTVKEGYLKCPNMKVTFSDVKFSRTSRLQYVKLPALVLAATVMAASFWLARSADILELQATCARRMIPGVLQSCSPQNEANGLYQQSSELPPRIAASALLQACVNTSNGQTRPLRFIGPYAELFVLLRNLGQTTFANLNGVPINFTLLPAADFTAQRSRMLLDSQPPTATQGYDVMLVSPTAFGDAGQVPGKLLDLSYLVAGDRMLNWPGLQAQSKAAVMYDGAVSALPVISLPHIMYYHMDIFKRDNLSVPQTWEELVDLAERYHGRDGMYGACVILADTRCRSESVILRIIFASYVLTHGQSQGLLWDGDTVEPLVNTPAMEAALKISRRLRAVGPVPSEPLTCFRREFNQGKCLVSVSTAADFKGGQLGNGTTVMRGRMGLALIPGSTHVLDRISNQMVPCNKERCPLAHGQAVVDGVALAVNRPLFVATTIAMLNGLSPPEYQFYAYNVFSYLLSPVAIGIKGLLLGLNELMPTRADDLSVEHLPSWVAAGYDEGDVRRLLALYQYMEGVTNINTDLKIKQTTAVTNTLLEAAQTYSNGSLNADVSAVMRNMEVKLNALVAAEGGKEQFAQQYRRAINWSPKTTVDVVPPHSSSGTPRTTILAVVIPCSLMGILGLGAVVWVVVRRRRWRLWLSPSAPGFGSATTLCITDIQDSTVLWESLPQEHMDAALKIHHRVIRQLLLVHHGYESATEGDSFILAFHNPLSALIFSIELQQALLDADWPQQLFYHEPLPGMEPHDDPVGVVAVVLKSAVRAFRACSNRSRAGTRGGFGMEVAHSTPAAEELRQHSGACVPAAPSAGSNSLSDTAGTLPVPQYGAPTPLAAQAAIARHGLVARVPSATAVEIHCSLGLTSDAHKAFPRCVSSEGHYNSGAAQSNNIGAPQQYRQADRLFRRKSGSITQRVSRIFSAYRIRHDLDGDFGNGHNSPRGVPAAADRRDLPAGAVIPLVVPSGDEASVAEATASRSNSLQQQQFPAPAPRYSCSGNGHTPVASAGVQPLSGQHHNAPKRSFEQESTDGSCSKILQPPRAGRLSFLANDVPTTTHFTQTLGAWIRAQYRPATWPLPTTGNMAASKRSDAGNSAGPAGGEADGNNSTSTAQTRDVQAVVFRGLRVRIGLHSGVPSPTDVSRNAASGRFVYSGYPLRLAKAVSDAAHGGMVLFSETTREELLLEDAALKATQQLLVLWMGRQRLGEELKEMHLFQAVSKPLAGRLALQRPLRTQGPVPPFTGVMTAPLQQGALARLSVVGCDVLLAWNYSLVMSALELLHDFALDELLAHTQSEPAPYVLEGAFGLGGRGRPKGETCVWPVTEPPSVSSASSLSLWGGKGRGGTDALRTMEWNGTQLLYKASVQLNTSPFHTTTRLNLAPPRQRDGNIRSSFLWAPVGRSGLLGVSHRPSNLRPLSKVASLGNAAAALLSSDGCGGGSYGRQVPGVMTVVFDQAPTAATWLARMVERMPHMDWPPELLEHPLCEEVSFDNPLVVVGSLDSDQDVVRQRLQGRESLCRAERLSQVCTNGRPLLDRAALAQGASATRDVSQADEDGVQQAVAKTTMLGTAVTENEFRPRSGVLFRGLRARCAVVYGELGGELVAGLSTSGHLVYRGKAWSALGKVVAKSKAGEVATNTATLAVLPKPVASLVVRKNT